MVGSLPAVYCFAVMASTLLSVRLIAAVIIGVAFAQIRRVLVLFEFGFSTTGFSVAFFFWRYLFLR